MPNTMCSHISPPGETEQLTCEGCGGIDFRLHTESWDGIIKIFHTLCVTCGKRGALDCTIEVTQTRKFTQFMDIPPNVKSGVIII